MTQRDRDRLVVLKQAHKRQITQKQAAEQLPCSERHVRRLLRRLKSEGDRVVMHGLRGRASNRKRSEQDRDKIVRILSQEVYHGFGPTLAAEYLAKKHKIQIGREALRKLMMGAALWQAASARWKKCTCGASGGARAASWCSGTLPTTTGWRDAARGSISFT